MKNNNNFNKKGVSSTLFSIALIAIIGLSIVAGLSFLGGRAGTQQTAIVGPTQVQVAQTGKASNLRVFAEDLEAATTSQLAIPAYCWDVNAPNTIVGGSAGTTTSATTTTAISPVSVGQKLKCIAFNATYTGDIVDITLVDEGGATVKLPIHRGCFNRDIAVQLFDQRNIELGASDGGLTNNFTAGASGSETGWTVEVRVNGTDCSYNLAGLYANTISDTETNITSLDVGGSITLTRVGSRPNTPATLKKTPYSFQSIKAQDDFVFMVTASGEGSSSGTDGLGRAISAIRLQDGDKIVFGGGVLLADGSGCGTTAGTNNFTFNTLDGNHFVSVKTGTQGQVLFGVENDAASPADLGVPTKASLRQTCSTQG